MGFPGGSDGKKNCLQFKGLGFDPWVGKIPWREEWQPTTVFLPGKSQGPRGLAGYRPCGLQSQRVRQDWATRYSCTHGYHMSLAYNPLKATASSSLWSGFQGVFLFFLYNFFLSLFLDHVGASLMAQVVKNPPAVQETSSLGQEETLEKEMTMHSSILGWEIPWTEEPGGLLSVGSQGVGPDWVSTHTENVGYHLFCIVLLKVK